MSERIHNGDFSGTPAFTWWINGTGGEPYILDSAKARADSDDESTSSWTYKICQPFDVYDEVVSAIITVWGQWETYAGVEAGSVQFLIKLQKPDSSYVTLKDQSYSNGQTGSGNLLDGVDIKSNFDQYGEYKLWLECVVKSAEGTPNPIMCSSWYDNISLDIAVKKYKTVHEILGSSGKLGGKASVSRSEIVGLHESYSTEVTEAFSEFLTLNACDATTDWLGTVLTIDTSDKKEGTGCLVDTIATPVATTIYHTWYNPSGSWDWSAKKHILCWLKSDRANTAFTSARVGVWDTSGNFSYWNLTFSVGEWTAIKKLFSTPDGDGGTPADLALVTYVDIYFKAADTTAFYKKIDDVRIDTLNYKTASESVGLSESYSKLIKRIRGAVEVVGLKETLQAKRTQGNLETTYTITDLTQWEETAKTETPWIKKKIEIVG